MRHSGYGSTAAGQPFSDANILAVWNKGAAIPGYDPEVWRRDVCGSVIRRAAYGKPTQHGWEIDHILPVAKGGTDAAGNLQPLHWVNNRRKGDAYPWSGDSLPAGDV